MWRQAHESGTHFSTDRKDRPIMRGGTLALLAAILSSTAVGCSCSGGGCGLRGAFSGGLLEDIRTPGKYYLADSGSGCPGGQCGGSDVGCQACGDNSAELWSGHGDEGVPADGYQASAEDPADASGGAGHGQSRPGFFQRLAGRSRADCNQVGCGLAPGPTMGAVHYPYYTVRGPRDFLMKNPPSIGN